MRSSLDQFQPSNNPPPIRTTGYGPGPGPLHQGMAGPNHQLLPPYGITNGATDALRYPDEMSDVVHTPTSHQSQGHLSHHSINSVNSLSSIAAQKRAYRQRRKDPSCDACRERKVKCDATDASSCSECTSRQVKCQFTKETNRRMSSMKQVQDLERQLHQARQQITQMKGRLQDSPGQPSASNLPLHVPDAISSRERANSVRTAGNFFRVRRNIRDFARGVFKPPAAYRKPAPQAICTEFGPPLPGRQDVESLLSRYKAVIHAYQPVVHWPTFVAEVEDIYQQGSFRGVRKNWACTFFAILACASLLSDEASHRRDATSYIEYAATIVNSHDDEVTVDQARVALLASVYFTEINSRSTGWLWLGGAIRAAQEAGLHVDNPELPLLANELRRRIWWSIYAWDRLCSLDTGNYHEAIDPDNNDVVEPTPIDDSMIKENGFQALEPGKSTPSHLLAVIPVVRLTHQLQKTLKSKTISPATLKIYDDHFNSIMDSLPDPFPLSSLAPLDPVYITIVSILQSCRFMLYRQNLTPHCRPQERQDAVQRCVQVAKDSAYYVWRTTTTGHAPGPRIAVHPADVSNPEWQLRMKLATNSMLLKHWWRCVLILCHVGDFATALTLVGAMGAVSNGKNVNPALGRNLTFYLELILQRWQTGRGAEIESDEELIAYASGDLQGSSAASWAWAGSGTSLSQESSSSSPGRHSSPEHSFSSQQQQQQQQQQQMSLTLDAPITATAGTPYLLSEAEEREWGSWAKVEDMLHTLRRLQSASPRPHSYQSDLSPVRSSHPHSHSQQQPPQYQQQRSHHSPTNEQPPSIRHARAPSFQGPSSSLQHNVPFSNHHSTPQQQQHYPPPLLPPTNGTAPGPPLASRRPSNAGFSGYPPPQPHSQPPTPTTGTHTHSPGAMQRQQQQQQQLMTPLTSTPSSLPSILAASPRRLSGSTSSSGPMGHGPVHGQGHQGQQEIHAHHQGQQSHHTYQQQAHQGDQGQQAGQQQQQQRVSRISIKDIM